MSSNLSQPVYLAVPPILSQLPFLRIIFEFFIVIPLLIKHVEMKYFLQNIIMLEQQANVHKKTTDTCDLPLEHMGIFCLENNSSILGHELTK